MKTIDNFILGLDGQQKAIVSYLNQLLSQHHDLIGKIQWNIPTYYRKSLICYLNPIKNNGVELAFFRGASLSNDQQLLNRKGRKLVAGIDLFEVVDLPEKEINEIVQEAIILDQFPIR